MGGFLVSLRLYLGAWEERGEHFFMKAAKLGSIQFQQYFKIMFKI